MHICYVSPVFTVELIYFVAEANNIISSNDSVRDEHLGLRLVSPLSNIKRVGVN